jgi:hypothetical protein
MFLIMKSTKVQDVALLIWYYGQIIFKMKF